MGAEEGKGKYLLSGSLPRKSDTQRGLRGMLMGVSIFCGQVRLGNSALNTADKQVSLGNRPSQSLYWTSAPLIPQWGVTGWESSTHFPNLFHLLSMDNLKDACENFWVTPF